MPDDEEEENEDVIYSGIIGGLILVLLMGIIEYCGGVPREMMHRFAARL